MPSESIPDLLAGAEAKSDEARRSDPQMDNAVEALSTLVQEKLSLQPPATQIQSTVASLESLQACVNDLQRQITARIAELKRFRNQNEVPLHGLPPEIFLEILSASIDWPNWNVDQNHTLARVCKHWWQIITTVSWFWPEIDVALGKEKTELILRMNQAGPLVIRCAADSGGHSERIDFMKLAVEHAARWKSLIFKGRLSDELFALLETPAPMLSELFIYPYTGAEQRTFNLGDGALLKHLDCDFCSLPWDSSRLSKLQSIQIRNLTRDLPSISQIQTILQSSPQLQWLLLASWSDDSQTTTTPTTEMPTKGKQVADTTVQTPIPLPALETLVLQNIPRDINDYLLTHIEAPRCTCLIAGVRPSSLRSLSTRQTNTYTNLLSPAIKAAPDVMLSFDETKGIFRIYSSPEPEVSNEWIHWVKRKPGINFLFHTHAESNDEVASDLCHALSGIDLARAATLNLVGDGTIPTQSTAATYPFPLEALQAIPLVTQVISIRNSRISNVLKYLAEPVEGSDSEYVWPLPALTTLSLSRWRPASDTKEMVDELSNFVAHRLGDSDMREDDWPDDLPKRLERLVVPPEVAQMCKETPGSFEGVDIQEF